MVWQRFGRVRNFVEPFFGSGAILLARPMPFEGSETINDADCMVSNFWRALQADPEAVAKWADWPVNEADLHARHLWLVTQKATTNFAERMRTEPDFYDAKIAGWWVWGLCKWIGSGWCQHPEWQQLPHLGSQGMGIDRLKQQLPHLGNQGRGIDRPSQKRPHLGNQGMGIDRPSQKRPHLGNGQSNGYECNNRGDIYDYFDALAARLKRVRVCCGDWSRVMGPTPTVKQGLTAVFLDPPYSGESGRDTDLYASECLKVAHDVRAWCEEWGHYKRLRIALCGYQGEHESLETMGWTCEAWKARGGYSSQAEESNGNAARERIWFSPNCIDVWLPLFANIEA